MVHPTAAVVECHLTGYRSHWRGDAFALVAQPLLTIVAFGVVLGDHIGAIDGVDYLGYVVPGAIAASAAQVAVTDATYPIRGNLFWQRLYHLQISAPLRVGDVLGGQVAFSLLRVVASTVAFLLFAVPFAALHSASALLVVPVAVLVALATGLPTIAFSATVRNPTYLELVLRCGVLPMTLFSGVFFPVESLPAVVRPLAYALPLWHGVDLSRAATLGVAPQWSSWGHVAYLLAWAGAGWWLSRRAFRAELMK